MNGTLKYRGKAFSAQLSRDALSLFLESSTKPILTVPLESVFAVHKKAETNNIFTLFTFQSKDVRKVLYEFEVVSNNNEEETKKWIENTRILTFRLDQCEEGSEVLSSVGTNDFGSQRRVLLLLNPFSGKKQGIKLFEKHVKPMLDVAHLSYVVIKTEHAQHALQYCKESDEILNFTDIVGMGGDGIIYEIINGLGSRKDWKSILQRVRIGHIAGGTSNALAVSSGAQIKTGKPAHPEYSAFIVARGFHQPMDLMSCFQAPNKHHIAFLSVTWTAIADVDIGTEGMRWLGGLRNTVGALKQVITKKSYRGKIKYLKEKAVLKKENSLRNVKENIKRYSSFTPFASPEEESSSSERIKCPLLERYFTEEFKTMAPDWCSSTNDTSTFENNNLEIHEVEDKFTVFIAANIAHLSYDFIASPMAHHHDGNIDLLFMNDQVSRGGLLNMFLDAEKGDHIFDQCVNLSKVKAFLLSPVDPGSFVVVDGEAVDYSDILVEVHPSACNLLTL